MRCDKSVLSQERGQRAGAGSLRGWKRTGNKLAFALALAAGISPGGSSAFAEGWIDTWAAAPQPVWGPDFLAPLGYPRNLWDQTVRLVARVSMDGTQVRITLSNEYGEQPMVVGEARVALHCTGAVTMAGSV